MQKLLEEVAFKIREFYDNQGCDLESASKDVIGLITSHLNAISKVKYEEVTASKPVREGECILIHSIKLNRPIIFGTVLSVSESEWKLAGRTYSPQADPQVFDLKSDMQDRDWVAYRVFIVP